jgi:hypothetical protein
MTLKVRVTWVNAGATLLPEALAEVNLEVSGSPLPVARKSVGLREFDIPDGTTKVTLKAQFSVKFGAVGAEPPKEEVVWFAEQSYDVVATGTELSPIDIPRYVKAHPLVELHAATATQGAALIRLRTELVDITPFWFAYADYAGEWASEHHPKGNLVALGSTGGNPKIMFASFNDACLSPPKAGISCLVFFRPAISYANNRVDQKHTMFGLNRFLLKPVDDPNADFWKRDIFNQHGPAGKEEWYFWLRCGFEDALDRCGKSVVMLHPWPNGIDFGAAAGPKLPDLAAAAIRFLWARQRIAKDRGGIHLGRLGISGYSAGGIALYSALASNLERVDEVYAFDARGASGSAGTVVQWFTKKPDSRCLRMSGGFQLAAHAAIKAAIEKKLGATARVSADPPSEKGYDPGVNPIWDHVMSKVKDVHPEYWKEHGLWHQLAMFGGYIAMPGPMMLTFLQRFLQDSDF